MRRQDGPVGNGQLCLEIDTCGRGGNPNTCPEGKCGIGTQFYISNDGTVSRLIDLPLRTGHAIHVNHFALGVETSNLLDNVSPPNVHWIEASANANAFRSDGLLAASCEMSTQQSLEK